MNEAYYKQVFNHLALHNVECNKSLIKKAIDILCSHDSQFWKYGELSDNRSLEIAKTIIELNLDTNCIIAALLHNTNLTLQKITQNFGAEVRMLVEGSMNLSKIDDSSQHLIQDDRASKLLMAVNHDVRILLIKLADRLYYMRTVFYSALIERRKFAAEDTLNIYAPFAERVGAEKIKEELQDICLSILYPKERNIILKELNNIDNDIIQFTVHRIHDTLVKQGVNAKVDGRIKTAYSILAKMRHKKLKLNQILDLVAFRIIVNSVKDCNKALAIITAEYEEVAGSFEDYISNPKPNGYRSIHVIVADSAGQKMEVQIRTNEMHRAATFGTSAHWRYKQQSMEIKPDEEYLFVQDKIL